MLLVANHVGASSWNQSSIKTLRSAPFSFEGISHLCMFGVKEPKSPQETRQVFDKQSTALEICRAEVPEQACSWTGERTHECLSEFVSLAHTRLGTSGGPRSGERRIQKA